MYYAMSKKSLSLQKMEVRAVFVETFKPLIFKKRFNSRSCCCPKLKQQCLATCNCEKTLKYSNYKKD